MAAKYQFNLASTVLTDVFTCPANQSVSVTVYICNRGGATTFRLSVAVAGEADGNKQYIYYDTALPANDALKESFTLAAGDVLRVRAASANVSVNVWIDRYGTAI